MVGDNMKRIKEKFSLVLVFMTILIIIGLTIIIGPTKHFIEEYNINFIDYLYNMTGIIICGLFFIRLIILCSLESSFFKGT